MDMLRMQLIRHWTVDRGPGGIAAVLFEIAVGSSPCEQLPRKTSRPGHSGGLRLGRSSGIRCFEHVRPKQGQIQAPGLGDTPHSPFANRGRPDLAEPRNFSGSAKLVDDF